MCDFCDSEEEELFEVFQIPYYNWIDRCCYRCLLTKNLSIHTDLRQHPKESE